MGVIPRNEETETSSLSDGDIWADSDEEFTPKVADDDFYGAKPQAPESTETAALRRVHAKKGYLDGLSTSKEESLQEGFDQGYPLGAHVGMEIGKIIGKLQYLSTMTNVDQRFRDEAKCKIEIAKSELLIQKVLHRKYFTDEVNLPNDQHSLIERWKTEVDQLITDGTKTTINLYK